MSHIFSKHDFNRERSDAQVALAAEACLFSRLEEIGNRRLRAAACATITPMLKAPRTPGSLRKHHAYEGGLIGHVCEVYDVAVSMADGIAGIKLANKDELKVAALCHDVMKTRDYELVTVWPDKLPERYLKVGECPLGEITAWVCGDYYRRIHHLQGSFAEFIACARAAGVEQAAADRIGHMILAHHGHRAWGSAVEPHTVEAMILHQADMLSANFGLLK